MSETTDHSLEVTVRFPPLRSYGGFEITGVFSSVGTNLFRLDDELFGYVGPIHFHDVIEARPTEKPGTVVYKRRVKNGGFKSDDRVLSRVTFELPLFHALESKIHGLGGSTARYFGGLWIVALPLDCDLNLAAVLRKISSMPTWKFRFYRARYSLRRLIRKILGATTEDHDAKSGGFTCTTSLANKKSDSE